MEEAGFKTEYLVEIRGIVCSMFPHPTPPLTKTYIHRSLSIMANTTEVDINEVQKSAATDDMGSKQATYQVNDGSQILGKYPIMVRVRVRVQLLMEQPNELRIIIN